MPEYTFKVNTELLTSSQCFEGASAEELRVLLAIIAHGSRGITVNALAKTAKTSPARAKAAIALFEEENILIKQDGKASDNVVFEFENNDEVLESASSTAKSIRDNDLYELLGECENLLEKSLEHREAAIITRLAAEKGLSAQYILTMLAFLTDTRTRVSVSILDREIAKRVNDGITTLEELEVYIEERSKEIKGEMELKRLFGLYSISPKQRAFFKKWLQEYGYSIPIISEAYDISSDATTSPSLPYIDKILTSWHNAGCKTINECRTQNELHREEYARSKGSKKSADTPKSNIPKYSNYDANEALMRALERSYSDIDD